MTVIMEVAGKSICPPSQAQNILFDLYENLYYSSARQYMSPDTFDELAGNVYSPYIPCLVNAIELNYEELCKEYLTRLT